MAREVRDTATLPWEMKDTQALELYIPPCIRTPPERSHLPPPERPLRVNIAGPVIAIQVLLPRLRCRIGFRSEVFPQPAGPELSALAHRALYGDDVRPEAVVVRSEYLRTVMAGKLPLNCIDYYAVTFDHNVPADDEDPEVLQLNIIDVESDGGDVSPQYMDFPIDVSECVEKKVLVVPRCCQKRKGTADGASVNEAVLETDRRFLSENAR